MYEILLREDLTPNIHMFKIAAPAVAKKAQAGQFIVIRINDKGERIPLTLADWDEASGTITLIVQEVGFTTCKLASSNIGDSIAHILGPLGQPTEIKRLGRVVCIGGGVGIAEIFPVARAFKQAGNDVVGIIGARRKELLILEDEMKKVCQELFITTDDGSFGRKGFVTDILKEVLNKKTDLVYAIGPVIMMRAVSDMTRPFNIKTIVSLNPIMVDATGMCGSCRCTVGDEAKFACVDGPDFDGHLVDFQELEKRINQFKDQEQRIRDTI